MQDLLVRRFSRRVPGADLELYLDLYQSGRALLTIRTPDDEHDPLAPASTAPSAPVLELVSQADPQSKTFTLPTAERTRLADWASRTKLAAVDETWERLRTDAALARFDGP